jgi:hypothetical protein
LHGLGNEGFSGAVTLSESGFSDGQPCTIGGDENARDSGGSMATSDEIRAWVYESLRSDVTQRQKNPGKLPLQLTDIEGDLKTKLQEIGEMSPQQSQFTDIGAGYKDQIREIVWGLVIQGIVVPGSSTNQPDLPFMQVTEWGKKCLQTGEYHPHDAGLYLARLQSLIVGVDGGILLYLQESLTAFRSGAYVASAVMTGVATERTLLVLRDAMEAALPTQDAKQKFAAKTKSKLIKQAFDEMWKRLDPIHDQLAADLKREDVRAELYGTFDLMRKTRNDAGHPTGRHISREEAHNLLLLFPQYCQAVYDTINWLATHPF